MTTMNAFPERKAANLSQRAFADMIGVCVETVRKIERAMRTGTQAGITDSTETILRSALRDSFDAVSRFVRVGTVGRPAGIRSESWQSSSNRRKVVEFCGKCRFVLHRERCNNDDCEASNS